MTFTFLDQREKSHNYWMGAQGIRLKYSGTIRMNCPDLGDHFLYCDHHQVIQVLILMYLILGVVCELTPVKLTLHPAQLHFVFST